MLGRWLGHSGAIRRVLSADVLVRLLMVIEEFHNLGDVLNIVLFVFLLALLF
jgi:hypothetical protein